MSKTQRLGRERQQRLYASIVTEAAHNSAAVVSAAINHTNRERVQDAYLRARGASP